MLLALQSLNLLEGESGVPTQATPVIFRTLLNITDEGNETYAATASGTSNTAQGLIIDASLPGEETWIECQRPDTGDASTVLAWDTVATAQVYSLSDYMAQVSTAGNVFRGQNTASLTDTGYVLPASATSRLRLHRAVDNTVSVQTTTDDGVNWTVRHTFAGTSTAILRTHFYTSWSTTTRKIYQPRQSGLEIITRYAADGNSQTAGVNGASVSYPGQLAVLLSRPVTNYGVGSQTTQDMIDDAASQIDANLQAVGMNVLIVAEVRNDLTFMAEAANAREAVDRMWEYCDGRRAAAAAAGKSLRILLWNILPSGATSNPLGVVAINAIFNQANALMAAEWQSHVHGYVDVRTAPELLDPDNATYFTDQVHLTEAGDAVLAGLIFNGTQSLASDIVSHRSIARQGGMMVFG